jgi:lactoylglutathione lyase
MTSVKHLDHLNLQVGDLADSIRFYRDTFGFEPVERGRHDGTPWAIIRSGEAMLCLYEQTDLRPGAGLNHFGLRISDEAEWEETLARTRVPVRYGGAVRWPHSTAWYVKDPSGYEIEVVLWHDDAIRFEPIEADLAA